MGERPIMWGCSRRRDMDRTGAARLNRHVGWKKKKNEPKRQKTERDDSTRAGRANREARPGAEAPAGVSQDRTADLANRASAANDPDRARSGQSTTTTNEKPTGRSTRLARVSSSALTGER